jgi:hypothetical protein
MIKNIISFLLPAVFARDMFTLYGGGKGGGGGGGTTTATTTTSNIPEYAQPYVEKMLGTAERQVYTTDSAGNPTGFSSYVPYSTSPQDYVAGLSPMQQQAQANYANMQVPTQFAPATQMSTAAGYGAAGTVPQAQAYGMDAANTGARLGYQFTNPYETSRYMSPYIQNVVANQQYDAIRQADIASTARGAQAARAGAFGGARQAIENAEANRNLQTQLGSIEATGMQQAYSDANKNMLAQAQTGLQGLSTGLQGVGQQLAGYGQMGTQAGQLGQLGTQQLGAQMGITDAQAKAGATQQEYQQNLINNAINNYAMAQQYPQQQLSFMSNLLHGLPMQSGSVQSYQAAPSAISQLAGLGTAAYGLSSLSGKKKGGVIKSGDGIDKLGLYKALNKKH